MVGPSGGGKTTLLRLLCGLMPANAGSVMLEGRLVSSPPVEAAMVFQDYSRSLLPWLTGSATSCCPCGRRGVARRARTAALEALARVGLAGAREAAAGTVRRHAAAGGDRPGTRLPAEAAGDGRAVRVGRRADPDGAGRPGPPLREEYGVTIVLVTHDIDEAVYLSDRVLVLSGTPGRIVASIEVGLQRPRQQTVTRSSPGFLSLRNEIHSLIAS